MQWTGLHDQVAVGIGGSFYQSKNHDPKILEGTDHVSGRCRNRPSGVFGLAHGQAGWIVEQFSFSGTFVQ